MLILVLKKINTKGGVNLCVIGRRLKKEEASDYLQEQQARRKLTEQLLGVEVQGYNVQLSSVSFYGRRSPETSSLWSMYGM